jgi:adenylate cyclase
MPVSRQIAVGASEDRLEKLIEMRIRASHEEKPEIDRRIWDLFGEDWAVMFTDLSGFSRKVQEFGIIHFLQTIFESTRVLIPCIDRFDGILLKTDGDSMLVIFRNVQKAINCSIEMQRTVHRYNQSRDDEEKILLGIGVGYGRVLRIGDMDVFGEEVNSAAKLGEDRAKAWDIFVTERVRNHGTDVPGAAYEPIEGVHTTMAYRVLYARE